MTQHFSYKSLFFLLMTGIFILSTSIWQINYNNQYIEETLLIEKKKSFQLQLINQLNQLSLELYSLDKQRSQYVFLLSQNKILQEYQDILSSLSLNKSEDIKKNIQDVEKIINELSHFKSTMKLRNDYLFQKKTLLTIINNNIDRENFTPKINVAWEMLKELLESNNLITLGELNRSFMQYLSTFSQPNDPTTKKLIAMANGANGTITTARNIIRNNIKLEGHIYDIQYYSSVLIKNLQDNVSFIEKNRTNKIPTSLLSNDALYFIIAITLIVCIFIGIFWFVFLFKLDISTKRSIDVLFRFYKNDNNLSFKHDLINHVNYPKYQNFISEVLYKFLLRTKDMIVVIDEDNNLIISSSSFDYYQANMDKNSSSIYNADYSISDQNLTIKTKDYYCKFPVDYIHKIEALNYKILFLSPPKNMSSSSIQNERLDSLGKISGEVAHDINNMLSVIIGCLNILRGSKNLIAKEDSQVIDRALFSADKSISIIDRLLTFACCQKLSPERVDVNDLIEGLYEVINFTSEKEISVTLDLSPNTGLVYIDPGQLEACIINLCINAINAIEKNGNIIIKTSVGVDDLLTLSVTDNGHGIDKNIRDRIFEPFFTDKKKNHGQGLGLSMVYGFVKQSGGYINVDSEVGVGTTMSLVFKLDGKS